MRGGDLVLIGIGSDHGGFRLKEDIKQYLTEKGIEFRDFGTHSTDSVDYPTFPAWWPKRWPARSVTGIIIWEQA
jgi:hypothetical protein